MIERRFFYAGGPVRLKWVALGWLAAELAVALALVRLVGLGTTILLGLATTVIGIVTLRRLGIAVLFGLRNAFDGRQPPEGALAEGMLAGLGALLLILPGFIANFVGLALAAPSVRRKVLDTVGGTGAGGAVRRAAPRVLDLGPTDWRAID